MRIDAVGAIAIDMPLTRNFGGSTYSVPNRPAPRDGTMDVPSGPGFGLALDEAMVRRHRVYRARG